MSPRHVVSGSGPTRFGNARALLIAALVATLALAATFGPAAAQRGDELQQMRQAFTDRNDATLNEPYRGISADTPERNLFPIRATGVSTEPVRRAAQAFLAALTAEQRARTTYRRRRSRVAQVGQPGHLHPPGRQLPRHDRGAAGKGVRPDARRA